MCKWPLISKSPYCCHFFRRFKNESIRLYEHVFQSISENSFVFDSVCYYEFSFVSVARLIGLLHCLGVRLLICWYHDSRKKSYAKSWNLDELTHYLKSWKCFVSELKFWVFCGKCHSKKRHLENFPMCITVCVVISMSLSWNCRSE